MLRLITVLIEQFCNMSFDYYYGKQIEVKFYVQIMLHYLTT